MRGFGTFRKEPLRLARINTPEVRGDEREDGLISRDWLREKINQAVVNNTPMYIKTYKDKTGKYGRYIADFYIGSLLYPCINDLLVQEGLAEYKEY